MARPTKQGIDYFPIDCQFDDKIEMYLIEKGAPGFAVLVSLWQMIYSNEGYYIMNNKDLHLLIKRKIDVDVNEVNDCINVCLSRNLFNQELHDKHKILTSKAIQKRYFEAAKKKKYVQIIVHYVIYGIDSYNNWVYVDGNATNVKEDVNVNVKVLNTMSGEPDDEPLENPKPEKKDDPPPDDPTGKEKNSLKYQATEVLKFLNSITGSRYQNVDANIDLIKSRLKEAEKQYGDIQTAALLARRICIDRKARWTDDEKMNEFLRPATLFAKKNFWNYAGQLPDNLQVDLKQEDLANV